MTDPLATTLLDNASTEVGFADNPASRLEQIFGTILDQQMQGLPVVNPALQVESVDFIEWEGHWLGVLVTPWFINLMIVPKLGSPWPELEMGKGKELKILFPQGSYTFSARHEQQLGSYLSCSLASPVHEWKSHADAVNTAHEVMRLIRLIPVRQVDTPAVGGCDSAKDSQDGDPNSGCKLTRRGFLGAAVAR